MTQDDYKARQRKPRRRKPLGTHGNCGDDSEPA